MTFRSVPLLWLLAAVPFAVAFLTTRERQRERLARLFVAERLRGLSNGIRAARPWLLAAGLIGAVVALAGPHAGFTTMQIEERESNRVVALDISMSMAARDVGATRLQAGKAIAKRIIDAHPGRVGLIIFEAEAEVIAPLTNDAEAVVALLESVQPGELSRPGSDLAAPLDSAMQVIEADPSQKADVVIISDGEDQAARVTDALRRVRTKGIAVSTIMLGSATGSTIPDSDNGELRDESGNVITTYANAESLERIANATGGVFLANPFSERALEPLAARRARGSGREKTVRVPVDRYQWPLAMAFVFFLLGSVVHRGAE